MAVSGQEKLTTRSGKAKELYVKARSEYFQGRSQQSISLLNEAITKDKRFIEAYLLKADIYHSMRDYSKEIEMLKSSLAVDSLFFIPAYYNLGVAEFNEGNYQASIDWFNRFVSLDKNKGKGRKVDDWIVKARFAMTAVEKPLDIEPVNMGAAVNSAYDEYWPSLTADERQMVITVLVPKDTNLYKMGDLPKSSLYFQEDFFQVMANAGGEWESRQLMPPPLNSDGNEGAQTVSADGNWMFFTACGRRDSKGSCDIYFSRRTGNGWSVPTNLGAPVNSPLWESQPTFSSDGQTLYFVSDRPSGIGKKDIWRSKIVGMGADGTPIFGAVENMGPQINTPGNENSPFMHPDQRTFYFSSDGWPGLGQMDIFVSVTDEQGRRKAPVNLGYPINTGNDEIGFVVNPKGDKAYFSSDGLTANQGGKDIYMIPMPESLRPTPVSYVKGHVYDADTKALIGASLELIRLADSELMVASLAPDYSGEFLFCLPPGNSYAFNVARKGYLFYSGSFDLSEVHQFNEPRIIDIFLQPVKEGARIVLQNVFFDTDSFDLKDESLAELSKMVSFLNDNSSISIEVEGHTDNVGAAAYNLDLSQKRARSVAEYLISKGINASRVTAKGYGMTRSVESNETDAGKAANRRTEMRITGKK
jgi:outer membrane protein OmpA-like peptidoglycan-associated protein